MLLALVFCRDIMVEGRWLCAECGETEAHSMLCRLQSDPKSRSQKLEYLPPLHERVKMVGFSVLAGIIASFLSLGVGGKAVVMFLEMVAGMNVELSSNGDTPALVFLAMFGGLSALIFAYVRPFIPGSPAARGGYFGLVLFIVLLPIIPASVQEQALRFEKYLPPLIALFGLILMGFGVLLEPLQKLFYRRKSV